MHWRVHYKKISRIRTGSHMLNTSRVISVQRRFPTLIHLAAFDVVCVSPGVVTR